jgi:hypothetical protein
VISRPQFIGCGVVSTTFVAQAGNFNFVDVHVVADNSECRVVQRLVFRYYDFPRDDDQSWLFISPISNFQE